MSRNNSGQALLEGLLALSILFVVGFGTLEIARLFAFKLLIQNVANESAVQLSQYQALIERDYQDEIRGIAPSTLFARKVDEELKNLLNSFAPLFRDFSSRTFVSFSQPNALPGVYVTIDACLPMLYRFLLSVDPADGDSLLPESSPPPFRRNCLGHILNTAPAHALVENSFAIKTSTYFPWPSSGAVFSKGVARPSIVKGLIIPVSGAPELASAFGVMQRETEQSNAKKKVEEFFKKPNFEVSFLKAR